MASHIGGMNSPDDWATATKLTNFLGSRLAQRRISLFLGAGVSTAFKLPQWGGLIDKLYQVAGEIRPKVPHDIKDAESLAGKPKFRGNPVKFATDVRTALYSGFSLESLRTDHNPMLSALGAMVMSSVRGTVASVVTFNFDDLLETYLRWHGFVAESIAVLPAWNTSADVTVLHPHGLLPANLRSPVLSPIVLTQKDYDRKVGNVRDYWHQRLTDILRSTTPIFIGLSGNDPNLTNMLTEVESAHPSKATDHFWGVRLTAQGDTNASTWQERGIFSFECGDHKEIPPLLMNICRRAAELRTARPY